MPLLRDPAAIMLIEYVVIPLFEAGVYPGYITGDILGAFLFLYMFYL